jgi:predicted nucleic acid-binding Zn ribbon protein
MKNTIPELMKIIKAQDEIIYKLERLRKRDDIILMLTAGILSLILGVIFLR